VPRCRSPILPPNWIVPFETGAGVNGSGIAPPHTQVYRYRIQRPVVPTKRAIEFPPHLPHHEVVSRSCPWRFSHLPYANAQTVTVSSPTPQACNSSAPNPPTSPTAAACIVSPPNPATNRTLSPLRRSLQDASPQPLMAYTIPLDGDRPIRRTCGYGRRRELTEKSRRFFLQAGAAVRGSAASSMKNAPGPVVLQQLQEQMRQSQWEAAKRSAISLDSAILASGQYVGPDTFNLFAKDAALLYRLGAPSMSTSRRKSPTASPLLAIRPPVFSKSKSDHRKVPDQRAIGPPKPKPQRPANSSAYTTAARPSPNRSHQA